ncbi:hypothetical protein [Bacillus thuringiensis]|uniref:hypothetical protein n=1 Tax=Bacillus thuringiensis TaxID=1428 RepID=UPI0018CD4B33|nr:hypothetical protein [Bacillus thuringiensis]
MIENVSAVSAVCRCGATYTRSNSLFKIANLLHKNNYIRITINKKLFEDMFLNENETHF